MRRIRVAGPLARLAEWTVDDRLLFRRKPEEVLSQPVPIYAPARDWTYGKVMAGRINQVEVHQGTLWGIGSMVDEYLTRDPIAATISILDQEWYYTGQSRVVTKWRLGDVHLHNDDRPARLWPGLVTSLERE